MPRVIEVPVPDSSRLFRALKVVHFCDAYQISLYNPKLNVQDAYEAVFGHAPRWVAALMAVRGVVAYALGLKHAANGVFQRVSGGVQGARYQIGQRVGLFLIQSIEANELIVGDNDKHLDFRISIYRSTMHGVETVTVSTAVEIHNAVGRLYMLVVKPFHRFIARTMMQRAADAGRM
jgi:hypothetical protein